MSWKRRCKREGDLEKKYVSIYEFNLRRELDDKYKNIKLKHQRVIKKNEEWSFLTFEVTKG